MVEQFIEQGDRVFAISRGDQQDVPAIEAAHFHSVQIDGYNKTGVDQAVATIKSQVDRIDLLINNASVFKPDPQDGQEIETLFTEFFRSICSSLTY